MIKRILVGICDPQYTLSAASYARELAQRFGATVTAISVTDVRHLKDIGPISVGAGGLVREIVEERFEINESALRQSLDLLARRLDEADVPCHVIKSGDAPYDALIDASRFHDLMVFGLRGLFQHGVTDEPPHELIHLIESGVRPILAAGPEYREVDRVLIAYSGSIESAKTIRDFANLNLWPDAELKVVHFAGRSADGPLRLAEARDYLQAHGFNVDIELIQESPQTQLLKHARSWNADLVVVGNSAKSLLRRRLFGEAALQTIRDSDLPLFLSQ